MKLLIGTWVILVVYEFVNNVIMYFQTTRLIKRIKNTDENEESVQKLFEYRQAFLKLTVFTYDKRVLKTYYTDDFLPVLQKSGTREDFPRFDSLGPATNMLLEAKGAYRSSIFNALNPLHWVQVLITLPSKIITYLGFKNNVIQKILNFIWWIILSLWWLLTPIAESLRLQATEWFKDIIQ